ncbi:MAG: hypothetical protein Q8S84_02540 [bacterium]|nr:hypothetical protein [bacterium]MDP3380423.1 hypothetical protein [bacterium]
MVLIKIKYNYLKYITIPSLSTGYLPSGINSSFKIKGRRFKIEYNIYLFDKLIMAKTYID